MWWKHFKKTIDILLFMLTMGFYGPKIDMLSILPSEYNVDMFTFATVGEVMSLFSWHEHSFVSQLYTTKEHWLSLPQIPMHK